MFNCGVCVLCVLCCVTVGVCAYVCSCPGRLEEVRASQRTAVTPDTSTRAVHVLIDPSSQAVNQHVNSTLPRHIMKVSIYRMQCQANR